ncbi:divalent cation tolerance protein CutA [Promicromonospora soli]
MLDVGTLASYDVPEVLVTPVIGGHQRYLEWVQSETQPE